VTRAGRRDGHLGVAEQPERGATAADHRRPATRRDPGPPHVPAASRKAGRDPTAKAEDDHQRHGPDVPAEDRSRAAPDRWARDAKEPPAPTPPRKCGNATKVRPEPGKCPKPARRGTCRSGVTAVYIEPAASGASATPGGKDIRPTKKQRALRTSARQPWEHQISRLPIICRITGTCSAPATPKGQTETSCTGRQGRCVVYRSGL